MTTAAPSGERVGAGGAKSGDFEATERVENSRALRGPLREWHISCTSSKLPLYSSCAWLVYNRPTGTCQTGFAHKVNMFSIFREVRA